MIQLPPADSLIKRFKLVNIIMAFIFLAVLMLTQCTPVPADEIQPLTQGQQPQSSHDAASMIGKTLPEFLFYIPFDNYEIKCDIEGIQTTVKIRAYATENNPVRSDIHIGEVHIAYWLPMLNMLLAVDADRKVTESIKLDKLEGDTVCQLVRGFYENGFGSNKGEIK